jgi:uncharacterized repeat protein (TIGR02543 family)
MRTKVKRKGSGPLSAALVLIALGVFTTLVLTGCQQEEKLRSQPKEGVLTVNGAEDGVDYEADVYKYTNAVPDADMLNTVTSKLSAIGTGTGTAVAGTLEIDLETDGEDFTSDGNFLVVLKDAMDDSAPLKYKASVPFTGGSATLEYEEMADATGGTGGTDVSSYTVTFDLNYTDAPEPPPNQEIDKGGKITLPSPSPKRTGYTFDGWYTSTAYTTKWNFDTHTVTTDINLYAKWLDNAISYRTVTFHTSGGTPSDFTQTVAGGSKAIEPATVPQRTDYAFGGWYKDAAVTVKYSFDSAVTGDLDLYAGWMPVYKVRFDTDGGTAIAEQNVAHGRTAARPPDTAKPTKTGYIFDNWVTAKGGATPFDFTIGITSDTTVYAKWMPIYKVRFDTDNVEPTPPPLENLQYGDTITDPKITKAGHTLDGWYKDTVKTTKWDFGNDTIKGNTALYAVWKRDTYKVTFYTGDAGHTPAPLYILYENTIGVPEITNTGYTIDGWYKEADKITKWDFGTDIVKENMTLYGEWKRNIYTVTFDTDGGSPIDPQTIVHGSTATRPPDTAKPTKTNYTFDDWVTEKGGTTPFNFNIGITAHTIIYAKWSSTVTFDTVGGSHIAPQNVLHGSTATRPADPTKTRFTFVNWVTEKDGTTPFDFNIGPTLPSTRSG